MYYLNVNSYLNVNVHSVQNIQLNWMWILLRFYVFCSLLIFSLALML